MKNSFPIIVFIIVYCCCVMLAGVYCCCVVLDGGYCCCVVLAGVFWIDWSSVKKFYDVIYMNWKPEMFKHKSTLHG